MTTSTLLPLPRSLKMPAPTARWTSWTASVSDSWPQLSLCLDYMNNERVGINIFRLPCQSWNHTQGWKWTCAVDGRYNYHQFVTLYANSFFQQTNKSLSRLSKSIDLGLLCVAAVPSCNDTEVHLCLEVRNLKRKQLCVNSFVSLVAIAVVFRCVTQP